MDLGKAPGAFPERFSGPIWYAIGSVTLLYSILLVCGLALLWAAAACYFRIKRHFSNAEAKRLRGLGDANSDTKIVAI
jgi:hypothetical protein